MSDDPLVSVVMSILNDEPQVEATLDSILRQEGVEFELIVINDGSTDHTGEILDTYAMRDPRLRVVHQENTGLTRALIRGCELARGKYIARQDGGGDISLPERLNSQATFLETHPNVVMVSSGTRFVGPGNEFLQDVIQSQEELQANLKNLDQCGSRGPSHHASTMFLRSAYVAVGGYRAEFAVAQDQDLWLRLSEMGACATIPQVLYRARLYKESISAKHRDEQLRTLKTILACARLRRSGRSDECVMKNITIGAKCSSPEGWISRSKKDARFYYFIGCLLRKQQPEHAEAYFRKSLRAWIFNAKAIVQLCLLRV